MALSLLRETLQVEITILHFCTLEAQDLPIRSSSCIIVHLSRLLTATS